MASHGTNGHEIVHVMRLALSVAAFTKPPTLQSASSKSKTVPYTVRNLGYFSLGSNVGDRESHLRNTIARLKACGAIVAVSSFYETEPVEFTEQAWLLHCAIA